jgi:hypothetical protein
MGPVDGRIFGRQQWSYPANVRIDKFSDIDIVASCQNDY